MRISRLANAVAAATCCGTIWALQQTADFGFGNDDSPTNVKAGVLLVRLAYRPDFLTPRHRRTSVAQGRWFIRVAAITQRQIANFSCNAPVDAH